MSKARTGPRAHASAAGRRAGSGRARVVSAAARAAGLDRLWAPWRMEWIGAASAPSKLCLFCRVSRTHADRRDLVLARREHALLMLNRYPYASAHLMIAVRRHAAQFRDLDGGERADLLELVALAEQVLEAEYAPHGVNYGMNVGQVAGAGFPGHLHMHMLPRWNGDTNFMPMIAQTRVLPEGLDATWSRLRRAIAAPAGGKRSSATRASRTTRPARRGGPNGPSR